MFPDFERATLDTLLRANGKPPPPPYDHPIENMLNATIENIL
jgi:hypothetical protein